MGFRWMDRNFTFMRSRHRSLSHIRAVYNQPISELVTEWVCVRVFEYETILFSAHLFAGLSVSSVIGQCSVKAPETCKHKTNVRFSQGSMFSSHSKLSCRNIIAPDTKPTWVSSATDGTRTSDWFDVVGLSNVWYSANYAESNFSFELLILNLLFLFPKKENITVTVLRW